VSLASYPVDFAITFNVTGTFLGFSKVAARVVRTGGDSGHIMQVC
jgi:hypothetical protein